MKSRMVALLDYLLLLLQMHILHQFSLPGHIAQATFHHVSYLLPKSFSIMDWRLLVIGAASICWMISYNSVAQSTWPNHALIDFFILVSIQKTLNWRAEHTLTMVATNDDFEVIHARIIVVTNDLANKLIQFHVIQK